MKKSKKSCLYENNLIATKPNMHVRVLPPEELELSKGEPIKYWVLKNILAYTCAFVPVIALLIGVTMVIPDQLLPLWYIACVVIGVSFEIVIDFWKGVFGINIY
jgi:hypothetical protein